MDILIVILLAGALVASDVLVVFLVVRMKALRKTAETLTAQNQTHQATIAALQQRDREKDELLTTSSHDLKSPLTALQMAVHLLMDDAAKRNSPQEMDLLKSAADEAERMRKMISQGLDAGRARLSGADANKDSV